MPKDGERVVCIFWVPVIDGQADGCSSSCQHAGNGISCGLGRLSDELLWGWFCGHVSDPGWSDNGQIMEKRGVGYKMAVSWKPLVQLSSNLRQNVLQGVLYLHVCHYVNVGVIRLSASSYVFRGCIFGIRGVRQHRKILPFVPYVLQCSPVVCMNVQFTPPFVERNIFFVWQNIVYRSLSSLLTGATMIYNEVSQVWLNTTFIEHIYSPCCRR